MFKPKFLRRKGKPKDQETNMTRNIVNPFELTDKQFTICKMLADGKSQRVIAKELKIHVSTVKEHLVYAMKKMGITDMDQIKGKLIQAQTTKVETSDPTNECKICSAPTHTDYCIDCQFAIDTMGEEFDGKPK
jgi:DNA-binding NarL/FixJ family response regulator